MDKEWKYEIPYMLFFYEKGKSKVKFHTHLLLSSTSKLKFDTVESLEFIFNTKIRKKRKCFSKWKHIDIEKTNNTRGILSYCNKETTSTHLSIDYDNSNLVTHKIN